jgi:hypothetical protein
MPRGRPRKHNPTIPAHIDQARIPPGIYWDRSGNGRWYIIDAHPEGGRSLARTVAGATARLSDLHAIAEQRKGSAARGTVAYVLDQFNDSLDFKKLAASTKASYEDYRKAIKVYPVKQGEFGNLAVDSIGTPVIRHLVNVIAAGKPATRPGVDAVPPYPSKANHWLRYLRRAFGWGVEYGACTTNPARGVKCVDEVRDHRMPELTVFRTIQAYARACSTRGAREKGHQPAYLWAAMELGYQARLRGIEVLTLTDAHDLEEELQTNRRKGSRDNLVRKGSAVTAAIAALQDYRATVWERKGRPIQIRPEQRPLFVGEDGEQLTRSGLHSAWGRMMRAAVKDEVITETQRFGLHGLKHRGITDTKGDKKRASGLTDAMVRRYDHELPRVEPADD